MDDSYHQVCTLQARTKEQNRWTCSDSQKLPLKLNVKKGFKTLLRFLGKGGRNS